MKTVTTQKMMWLTGRSPSNIRLLAKNGVLKRHTMGTTGNASTFEMDSVLSFLSDKERTRFDAKYEERCKKFLIHNKRIVAEYIPEPPNLQNFLMELLNLVKKWKDQYDLQKI